MKTSTVLKRAKRHLAKNCRELDYTFKESFICYSISSATDNGVSDTTADRVVTMVQERLAPHATLDTWLDRNHGINRVGCYDLGDTRTAYLNKIQATRHAWVDSMIEEFEAKGD